MMNLQEQAALSQKAARALNNAPPEVVFEIRRKLQDEVLALMRDDTPLSREVERFLDRYGAPRPTPEVVKPLTALEVDELLTEVVMGVADEDSDVRDTSESREVRERLRTQVREMMARGVMPMVPN